MKDQKKEGSPRIKGFSLKQVTVTNPYSKNGLEKELAYLRGFDLDKLLAGFYEMQGEKAKASKYPGWESTEIQGHTIGHYMVALGQAYMNTKEEEWKERLDYLIDELAKCQFKHGYLFASREEIFDRVEQRKPAWVPWYTMHKILSGIIMAYQATANPKALEVASKLGSWVFHRTRKWTSELQELVLSVEYGGMNDVMYDLYRITNNPDHLYAAHMFDEKSLFAAMRKKEDILDGRHANTTIPKIVGALNRYLTLGDGEEAYLEAAINFWDIVIEHHTYVTGGNSEWEHFGKSDVLDSERTNCNCETCNTYNMLKLSKGLFEATADKKYADFYEKTHWNAIVASQNPETGMTTYFQPMAVGYFKVFGTPYDKFWCCTGTGMENFTKLNDGIYYECGNRVYVNRYISSILEWKEEGMTLIQETQLPEENQSHFTIESEEGKELQLAFRVPAWCCGEPVVHVNGVEEKYNQVNGFIILDKVWVDQDKIDITLPMKVQYHRLADNQNTVAFTYGPVVLCATLGTEDMSIIQTGVAVDIPTKEMPMKDFIVLQEGTLEHWLFHLSDNLVRVGNGLSFALKGTDEDQLIFTPYYEQYKERYGIYWEMVEPDSKELQKHILQEKDKKRFEHAIIDKVPVGNDQYELVHKIKGDRTEAGGIEGHRCRVIREHGWFSYELKVEPADQYILGVTYFKPDIGKVFKISLDNELMIADTLKDESGKRFFDVEYEVPQHKIKGKKQVVLRYEHGNPMTVNSIWDLLYLRKGYGKEVGMTEITINGAVLSREGNTYLVKEEWIEKEVSLHVKLENSNGLVYINEILIDDSLDRKLTIRKGEAVQITVVSEDRLVKKQYLLLA